MHQNFEEYDDEYFEKPIIIQHESEPVVWDNVIEDEQPEVGEQPASFDLIIHNACGLDVELCACEDPDVYFDEVRGVFVVRGE